MTPKQAKFVQEYLVDRNATQAAIRAGYSPDTAKQIGSENLSKPDVKAAIEAQQQDDFARLGITRERILQGILNEVDAADSTPQSRLKAWELIGKTQAMFVDKQQVEAVTTLIVDSGVPDVED